MRKPTAMVGFFAYMPTCAATAHSFCPARRPMLCVPPPTTHLPDPHFSN